MGPSVWLTTGESRLVLFSHPADFTPVCRTEFVAFAGVAEQLRERGVEWTERAFEAEIARGAEPREPPPALTLIKP